MHRNDKPALEQLKNAMAMIKAMSANHHNAQRAYLFLRQVLNLMDKSLELGSNFPGPTPLGSPTPQPASSASQFSASALSNENANANTTFPDLLSGNETRDFITLLSEAQDLTEMLGTRLESHAALPNSLWSWASNDNGELDTTWTELEP